MKIYIAVYDSLRKGMNDNQLLYPCEYVNTVIKEVPYKMVPLNYQAVFMKDKTLNKVVFDIYVVEESAYKNIVEFERLRGMTTIDTFFYDNNYVRYFVLDKDVKTPKNLTKYPSIVDFKKWIKFLDL